MTSTLVDSNVLIDIFQPHSAWHGWSGRTLREASAEGRLVVNVIIAAEVGSEFLSEAKLLSSLSSPMFSREDLPWQAAYQAGLAYRDYRQRGGERDRMLPDFLIGAHAQMAGHRLLTRDSRRYRTYFPQLEIIAPDTHP